MPAFHRSASTRLALVITSFLIAHGSDAQGSGVLQDIETSIRAAGMGGATTAVGWGEPGVWGNPASLAGTRGIAVLEGNTLLYPQLDGKLRFESRRFLVGAAGVGVSLMGEPFQDLGHARLSSDATTGTDPFGNPTGSAGMRDQSASWGVGVSPLRLLEAIPGVPLTRAGALARVVDVGVGYQHKRTRDTLVPGQSAEAGNFDWGVYARVAPVAGSPDGRSIRVEFSFGLAHLNADRSSHFVIPGIGDLGPSTRIRRTGVAARAELPFGAGEGEPRAWSWWPASLSSVVALGLAYDLEERGGTSAPTEYADHWGFEASFMELVAARLGYVDDSAGDLHHFSAGLGVHAPIGPWATIGYDWANYPVGSGLNNQNRHGWSAWLHPDAIWGAWPGGR